MIIAWNDGTVIRKPDTRILALRIPALGGLSNLARSTPCLGVGA